jgi:hypothetical protein
VKSRLHCFGHNHGGYRARRIEFGKVVDEEDGDDVTCLTEEWVGRNQWIRNDYSSLSPGSAEAFRDNLQQTLMVNAAIQGVYGEPDNMPWLVELGL